ncbi:MAG: chemotaxis protein CheW [Methylovirgula sp.]
MAAVTAQFVTLGVDREVFGLRIALVREILDACEISRLPRVPDYVLGMIDVRGEGVPVLDLRLKLGLPAAETTPATRIIVLELDLVAGRAVIGLRVDCVFEVTELDGGVLEPAPNFGARWRRECISGIGRRGKTFVVVLDLPNLLADDDNVLIATAPTETVD